MIKSLTFIEDYELSLEKKSQKRWGVKTYKPTAYTREKKPWKMFFLFRKGLHIDFNAGVNIIVGENGSGKSTLFALIHNYVGVEQTNPFVKAFTQHTEEESIELHRKNYEGELSIESDVPPTYKNTVFFNAEKDNPVMAIPKMINPDGKNFASMVSQLFDAEEESHGESLLPVLKYILENAKDCCIFLDEPETALSLSNQVWLVKAILKSSKKNNNQIFVSTHALALMLKFQTIFDMESRKWVNREEYIRKMLK